MIEIKIDKFMSDTVPPKCIIKKNNFDHDRLN